MPKLCWKGTWSFSLLVEGFGFREDKPQIAFAALPNREGGPQEGGSQEGGPQEGAPHSAFGWALGSMLVDVNFYPWRLPERSETLPLEGLGCLSGVWGVYRVYGVSLLFGVSLGYEVCLLFVCVV